jgi:hypothetical protein
MSVPRQTIKFYRCTVSACNYLCLKITILKNIIWRGQVVYVTCQEIEVEC